MVNMYDDLLGSSPAEKKKRITLEELIVEEVRVYVEGTRKLVGEYSKFIYKVLNPRSGLTNAEALQRSKRIQEEMQKYEKGGEYEASIK